MINLNELDELLFTIKKQFDYDFRDYSKASILRRINRFMTINNMKNAVDLKFELINNPSIFQNFINEIVVNVSEFFRDPSFFKSLQQKVFPYLESYPKINIWSAGCSFGEETYSLNILLKENNLYDKSRIYATDISSNAIEKSRKGIYDNANFKEYTKNYYDCGGKESLKNYFVSDEKHSMIQSELKKNILFSNHNLVTDSVFKECQLILCRNVLIYFNNNLQNKALELFYESLPVHGFLAIGKKESLRFSSVYENFKEIDREEKIYQKIK
ncbi:chemotaxis protein methyltransferase CheR [Flavobacterium glycines]|uniref:Chemotaxis protein CheR n=1 Tax=Flavobacterium glycines TaxID=551990 RepID=A0A1B9DWK5_9FLAO|nr:protein-glutamate O-methyltransferase CheR [Flavobacterium glycines]OCB74067.1 chemotaxis protein CheR [Flavobacterium glycines]GEL09481.1 chemotaxis protein R [Flavobacterium glycines]SDJ05245.1 chemotaxis protein methyltransferase CheR [Flavobacterium glycines]